jgi:hypothetical protein
MFDRLKLSFLARKFKLNFILQPLFQPTEHFYEKREGIRSGAGSVPVTNESGCGSRRPQSIRIRMPITGTKRTTLIIPCS